MVAAKRSSTFLLAVQVGICCNHCNMSVALLKAEQKKVPVNTSFRKDHSWTEPMSLFPEKVVILLLAWFRITNCQLFGNYGVKWTSNLKSRDYSPESRLLLEVSLHELDECWHLVSSCEDGQERIYLKLRSCSSWTERKIGCPQKCSLNAPQNFSKLVQARVSPWPPP